MSEEAVIRWICDRCRKVVEFARAPGDAAKRYAPNGWGQWTRYEASGRHAAALSAGYLLCPSCDSAVTAVEEE